MTNLNCVELHILIHYRVYPNEIPMVTDEVPSYMEAVRRLKAEGLIQKNLETIRMGEDQASLKLTEKGDFYLDYILNTPFPKTNYVIPRKE